MKKSLIVIGIIFILGTITPVQEVQSNKGIQTIPDEAIRLRILANSDDEEDQYVKRLVRDEVNAYISELVKEIADIEVARDEIEAALPDLRRIVSDTLKANDVDDTFTVDYRSNVTFPLKMYDNYVYPAGEYEAVLITIGAGKGANWWCVLFPPLCFLDFSNGTTIEDEASASGTDANETETTSDEAQKEQIVDDANVADDLDKVGSEKDVNSTKQVDGEETEEVEDNEKVADMKVDEEGEEEVTISFFLFEWLGWS